MTEFKLNVFEMGLVKTLTWFRWCKRRCFPPERTAPVLDTHAGPAEQSAPETQRHTDSDSLHSVEMSGFTSSSVMDTFHIS